MKIAFRLHSEIEEKMSANLRRQIHGVNLRTVALVTIIFYTLASILLQIMVNTYQEVGSFDSFDSIKTYRKMQKKKRGKKLPSKVLTREEIRKRTGTRRRNLTRSEKRDKKYDALRRDYDEKYPEDEAESISDGVKIDGHSRRKILMESLRTTVPVLDFDDVCPPRVRNDYPKSWNVSDVLKNWEVDDTDLPSHVYQGICIFDAERDHEKIMAYREAEVPFVIRDHPEVIRSAERWNDPTYLSRLFDDQRHHVDYNPSGSHFMYFDESKRRPKGWTAPTRREHMSYNEWLNLAEGGDEKDGEVLPPASRPHWYFRPSPGKYLYMELPFFKRIASMFIVEPKEQQGIFCRFGMRGIIAESHFDHGRNMIALLGGKRRYILSHPNQCSKMSLYPDDHPSGRHSSINWSDPDWDKYPEFAHTKVNEIILQAGDVLYLPTHWFHFIVSLEENYQCNSRSGRDDKYLSYMNSCGFPWKKKRNF